MATEHKQGLLLAAGEALQCFVGFVVAAIAFNFFAGAVVAVFWLLAVVVPLLVVGNAVLGGGWLHRPQPNDNAGQIKNDAPPGGQSQGEADDGTGTTKV